MNVETIKMPRSEARRAFLDYRKAVKERHSAEDEAIMRGYKALAEGSALLDLRSAFPAAGQFENGLPKIAICRAHFRWCYFEFENSGTTPTFVGSMEALDRWNRPRAYVHNVVRLAPGVLKHPVDGSGRFSWPQARALVPSIPPSARPSAKLENFHILWEAEWQPRPPTDPLLLRHLGGTLYVVLAQWDLTEVERAVLAGRLHV